MKHNEINYDTFIVVFAILLLGDIYFIILSFLNMRYFKIIIASENKAFGCLVYFYIAWLGGFSNI